MKALLILENMYKPGSVYEYILVDENRLSDAYETVKLAYDEWVRGCWWTGTNEFKYILKALKKAGISYKRIEHWNIFKL